MYFDESFTCFFEDLEENNNESWFRKNRLRYHESVEEPWERFVSDFLSKASEIDPAVGQSAKNSIYEIHKDIRFSDDDKPHKLQMSAAICDGGKDGKKIGGIIIEAGRHYLNFYSGLYAPDPTELANFKSFILKKPDELEAVLSDQKMLEIFGGIKGQKAWEIPPSLEEAVSQQPFLKYKSFYVKERVDSNVLYSSDLLAFAIERFSATYPLTTFLRKAIQP